MKLRWMFATILSLALAACSSSKPAGGTGEGGALGSGGAQTTGGATSAGGTSSGGMTSAGGATQPAAGGKISSGGAPGTGGNVATGGSAGAGATGTGGSSGTGGVSGTGGTTQPTTGGQASGGIATTGGSTGAGGTTVSGGGTTGQLTPQQAAQLMAPGWNLGNSFDADPDELGWGNPEPTQALINAVHSAGFNTLRLPVTWTKHLGAGPAYTIDSAWMAKVTRTAQWAVDAGMYVFVNTHHEADANGSGWVTFPASTSAAQGVADEVTAVWTQIATSFKSFNSHLMFECFNEPNVNNGDNTPTAQTDLNMYLEACFKAIRNTAGANATRIVMIQPCGASPDEGGIKSIQKVSFINDPNLVISLHTYFPNQNPNFCLSNNQVNWGTTAADYTAMEESITKAIRVWLPTQVIFVGEWGSQKGQLTAQRAPHALAYAQDTTTAGIVPIWWDDGGDYILFNRSTGGQVYPTIVSGIMTGVKNGLAAPNTYATHP